MGNESSKQATEQQQLILQLQQQLSTQQKNNIPPQNYKKELHNNYSNYSNNISSRLPVISPAELLQREPHPTRNYEFQTHQTPHLPPHQTSHQPQSLLEILNNKVLMAEIDKNPNTKRKFLERLLNEHKHIMTTQQVQRITNILNSLPPAEYDAMNTIHNKIQNKMQNTIHNIVNYNETHKKGFNEGTTRQDIQGKELQRQEQCDTIDALTRHYKTEAEREQAEFKQEEERRKREFLEKQRQRRMEYQTKLDDLEKNNIDALRIFNLQSNFSLNELKSAFKKLAMQSHPDKPTGNVEQFQFITKCYLSLLEKYKARESDRPFNELKKGSQTYLEDQEQSRNAMMNSESFSASRKGKGGRGGGGHHVDKEKFDLKLFNKIYEQNKLWDSNDDGYGNWLSSNDAEEAPTELFGNKFNLNVFNSTFENYKEQLTSQSGAIQEYNEPRELVSCSTGFTDLDQDSRRIDDFSKPLPIAPNGKLTRELGYTDLKTAYTSRGAFIDPNKVEYKTYKNVEELKRDRGNVRYDMTPDELRAYQLKQYKQNEEESHRQSLIRDRDHQISNTYSKTHQRMLGYHATAPS